MEFRRVRFRSTRLKSGAQIQIVEKFWTDEKKEHILNDADIRLTGFYTAKKYPDKLRVVKVYDEKNQQELTVMTNNFSWTAQTISDLYKRLVESRFGQE